MAGPERILFLFVDGLGLPSERLDQSIFAGMPTFRMLLQQHSHPLDATLGVEGLPQSATGQTTIFTGLNASKMMGRHMEGFPTAALRETIVANSLFSRLRHRDKRCCFANAYTAMPGSKLPLIYRSVTTVMTLGALGETLGKDDLLAGRAVSHDLTRQTLHLRGIEGVPVIDEGTAAEHLISVFRGVDLCLFEYFLTDHAGHGRTHAPTPVILASLERFLTRIVEIFCPEKELLLLTSDHGNIEHPHTRKHTANPVPWITYGCGAEQASSECTSIQDICGAILKLLNEGKF